VSHNRINAILTSLFSLLAFAPAHAEPWQSCERSFQISSGLPLSMACDRNGTLRKVEVHFMSLGQTPFLRERYLFDESGKLIENHLFSSEGKQTAHWLYTHLGADRYSRHSFQPSRNLKLGQWRVNEIGPLDPRTLVIAEDTLEHLQWTGPGAGNQWALRVRDHLGPRDISHVSRIRTREIYNDENTLSHRYHFEGTSRDGLTLSKIFVEDFLANTRGEFDQSAIGTSEEFQTLLVRARSQGAHLKQPIALIDSGFDLTNDDLLRRVWLNPREVLNNRDNDGDGLRSNVLGYMRDAARKRDQGVVIGAPRLDSTASGRYPVCHGTHVGDLFSRNLKRHGVMAFGGDYPKAEYMSLISKALKTHGVRFANMSFDFGSPFDAQGGPMALPIEYLMEVGQMVQKNSQTLFFIAAGNDYGLNLDENERWPATVESSNKMVVAALDVGKLKEEDLWKYQLADFSNFGPRKVDIATPGTDVLAWNIAHHKVPLSGTSMASPIAGNIAVKIAERNEALSNAQIKEIMMKTVFIHDLKKPLPIRSGGIAIERRALRAAALMKADPSLTAESAAIRARLEIRLPRELEGSDTEDLKAFWRARGL
jgi:hypothetical protein